MMKLTQLQWLMNHLEPHEALELRAACDSFMTRGNEALAHCPVCWLPEMESDSPSLAQTLVDGFVWSETPQGRAYWSAVHAKYKALEDQRAHNGESA